MRTLTHSADHNPVRETLDSGESFTVPSDEKWVVSLALTDSSTSNNRIYIDSTEPSIRGHRSLNGIEGRLYLDGDTTVEAENIGTGRFHVTGFDVSETLPNEFLNVTVADDSSPETIPDGVWYGTYFAFSSDNAGYGMVNGELAVRTGVNDSSWASGASVRAALEGGDTIGKDDNDTAVHFSAQKVADQ